MIRCRSWLVGLSWMGWELRWWWLFEFEFVLSGVRICIFGVMREKGCGEWDGVWSYGWWVCFCDEEGSEFDDESECIMSGLVWVLEGEEVWICLCLKCLLVVVDCCWWRRLLGERKMLFFFFFGEDI